jgi:hypothetical protein
MTRNLSEKDFCGLGNADDIASSVVMLSVLSVESVRREQREEGNFDCFGRASAGFCDQTCCLHHANCMYISKLLNCSGERKYINA